MIDVASPLYQIAALPPAADDIPALLDSILEKTGALLAADIAVLFEADAPAHGFRPLRAWGMPPDSIGRLPLAAPTSPLGQAIAARRARNAPPNDPLALGLGLSAAAYAPAFGDGELAGLLFAGRLLGQAFDDDALLLLDLLAQRAGAALETARKLAQSTDRLHELSLLLQSTADISSTLNLDAILKSIAVHMLMATAAQGVAISEWDQERDEVVILLELLRGVSRDQAEPPGTAYPLRDYPATRMVLVSRTPLVVQAGDPNADPSEVKLMQAHGILSLLMLPIVAHDQVLGLVELRETRRERAFSEREIELAQALANQAASAMLNARLLAGAERRVTELSLLNEIGQEVTASLDLDETLNRVLARAKNVIGAQAVQLMLRDEATGDLVYRVGGAEKTGRPRGARIGPGEGIAGWVAQHGRPRLVSNILEDPQFAQAVDHATGVLTQSVLAVPLKVHDRTIGVVEAINKPQGRFTAADQALLGAVAAWAAVAIENARLYKRAEDERRQLNAVLEDTADAVIVADEGGHVLLANSAAARAFAVNPAAIIGQPAESAFPDSRLAELLSAPDAPPSAEVQTPQQRTFQASVAPVEGVGRVAVLRDITYLKELDRLRSELLGTAAHDLKNPITAINLAADLLPRLGALTERQAEQVAATKRAARRMVMLITDLLDMARIESGMELRLRNCDLSELLAEALRDHQSQAQARRIALDRDWPDGLPPVRADPHRIRQVIANLMSNAVKYTPDGGEVRLRARVADASSEMLVQVCDNGLGIGPDDLPKVFDRFYRVKNSATQNIEGTGLGLAIVKSIVERHGARIWAESQGVPGKGSTFSFTLPLATSAS